MVWDGIVACDLFFAGMGAWTFVFAVFASGRDEQARKAKIIAVTVACVAVGLGALILAVDAKGGLLHPLRYLNLLGNFGSVMTWGVVLISLFLIGAFACIVLLAMRRRPTRLLELAVAVLGVGVSLYTGILLGTASAFPLWNPIALPIAFVISAAYTGYAAFGLAAHAGGLRTALPAWVNRAALTLPVLEIASIALLLAVVSMTQGSAGPFAAASIANLLTGSNALAFWVGVVAVGVVIPFSLALVRRRQGGNAAAWMSVAEQACILVGGFAFRYAIVMAAVPMFA